MKFRKRPVVIDAGQYIEEANEPDGLCWELGHGADCPHVHTLTEEGDGLVLAVVNGDWVITEPDGIHFYSCKNDIFQRAYEAVDPFESKG